MNRKRRIKFVHLGELVIQIFEYLFSFFLSNRRSFSVVKKKILTNECKNAGSLKKTKKDKKLAVATALLIFVCLNAVT